MWKRCRKLRKEVSGLDAGFGRHTLVFEIDVNNDDLIPRLLRLKEQANEVAMEAGQIIRELQQVSKNKS